ncbi:LodA/GoxA family CTQ-dependent oxidase, partial [Mycobacterium kansasii]
MDQYFIGPETPGMGPSPGTEFKDAQGRIKRQAARFRVYGYDAAGNVVQEITALTPGAKLRWTV